MEENALLVYLSILLFVRICCRWGPRDHFDDLPVISGGRRANHLSTGTNTKDGSSTRRSHGAVDFHWSSIGMWWQLHVKLLSLIYFSVVWYLTYEVANCLHGNVVLTMKLFRVTCSKDIFTQSYILVQKIYSLRVDAAAPFLCGELDEKTTEIANNQTCSGDSI